MSAVIMLVSSRGEQAFFLAAQCLGCAIFLVVCDATIVKQRCIGKRLYFEKSAEVHGLYFTSYDLLQRDFLASWEFLFENVLRITDDQRGYIFVDLKL